MTTSYLQRIEISNFRAYGDSFSLSLPGPGVTILTGPEGLGKSAFFEAIEWALTGRVRRLEVLPQEGLDRGRNHGLLARRATEVSVAQYGVSLEFVNGEGERTRLERRAVREQENPEQFAEVSSPPQPTHAGAHAALVSLQSQLQAVLEADERRRGAEFRRDTLLRLSAARTQIAQGVKQKSSVTAQLDRHTHELWMIQSYLHSTTKTIQRIKDLESRIHSLLLAKQELEKAQEDEQASHRARLEAIQLELEAAQATRAPLPDLEYLNDYQAGIKARIEQLPPEIKEEHEVIARIEEELRAAHALQQQYPELLSALGPLPSDEAKAIDEAARAVASELQEQQKRLEELRQVELKSQWPALLLDDPPRYHDAAFLEVLRTLVRDGKYQAILSIHDAELADSLRRELEAAGIECVTCRYSGLGPTGVLYSTA